MFYLFNAVSCAIWHIQKKHQKYIFMFTELKVVHTIKIGTHTGPLCHTENVPSWMFSWYCEKSRWKALSFFMINMIWIMRPLIWIFTKQHFYLIHGPYGHQKYGIAFSWPIRCHNMSCETIKASCRILSCGLTTWWIDPNCKVLPLNCRIFSNVSKWILKYCNLACIICKKIRIFLMKRIMSLWGPKWLLVKMTTKLKMIFCNHGYGPIMIETWYANVILGSNL